MQLKIKWGAATVLTALIIVLLISAAPAELSSRASLISPSDTIVIDPGHGGMDGGAVGAAGISEKDINLAIALAIRDLAEQDGWKVVMTREEDKGLYTGVKNDGTDQMEIEGKRSIRSLKTEDLKERKAIVEKTEPVMAVSIHLNSFKQDPGVHGAQTFYPSAAQDDTVVDRSKELAEHIQEKLVAGLDDGTDRIALGKKDVMLFKNPTVPMVIVECGFLSNRAEEQRLCDEEYQKKIAALIYDGMMEFSGKERRKALDIIDNRTANAVLRRGYDLSCGSCG
ncbi:N-acetylmuramoyl-L-alanine amidase [Bacilliculturomica massiliensis]|uniref:N-acetylmuramoyl-L-alanine amidase n=1 Tax=Bacilliculturomica massiliensis TaxID=1917867 RepID=UPI001031BAFE|nr:N-acetylmuramoyl-L-alanine amidase [Bacilliculturomica massiliensis]